MVKETNFWVGVLVGAAAGAAAALFTAPKSGSELREDIGHGVEDVGRKAGAAWGDVMERASDVTDSAKHRAEDMADKTKDVAMSAKDRIQNAIRAGRQAADEKRHEMTAQFEPKQH